MHKSWLLLLLLIPTCGPSSPRTSTLRTENVVLITLDGLRHEELFRGIDATLLPEEDQSLRQRYQAATAEERRRRLMPFFWEELAPQGVVLGNPRLGSVGRVANPHRFSYPGYAELLTGRVLKSVDSNDPVRIPEETVLEYARRQLNLQPHQVACIASWSTFEAICSAQTDTIFRNAGVAPLPEPLRDGELALLNTLQREILPPWDEVRSDAVTFHIALEYLERRQPRLLYIALDDTDDWAHQGRYDRVVQTIHLYDDFLRQLWRLIQSMPRYHQKTTLLLTTDHGRGGGAEDWTKHGKDVPGAEYIWLAVVGPDTPARGELSSVHFTQKDIAPTLLRLLGLDPSEYSRELGPVISEAFETPALH